MTGWPLQIAVYAAGDAGGGGAFPALQKYLWRQLAELSGVVTSPRVAALAQLDNFTAPSMRWVLDPLRRHRPLYLPETNTGDPAELADFCAWSERTCPSERHALVLSGHGLAFQDNVTQSYYGRGVTGAPVFRRPKSLFVSKPLISAGFGTRAVLMDQSDFLTVPELRGALGDAADAYARRRFDVVVFDACLMSNIELLYELRAVASAIVGAVDEISGEGLNLAGAARRLDAIGDPQALTPALIAESFVDAYAPGSDSDTCIAVVLDRALLETGVEAFARFASLFTREIQANDHLAHLCRDALAISSRALVRYKSKSLADLNAVALALRETGLSHEALAALDAAMRAFAALVSGGKFGADYANALGISVFAPSSQDQLRINAVDYRELEFARRTRWLDALQLLFSDQLVGAAPYASGSTFKPSTLIS